MTLIRSMQCDQPVHTAAMTEMHTGTAQFVRPSLGAWALYGLGTKNDSLPGFVSINPPDTARSFGSAFLPAAYSGTKLGQGRRAQRFAQSEGSLPDLGNPVQSKSQQRSQLDLIQTLNREKLDRDRVQPGVEGIIQSYELAFRMQDALPAVMDTSGETRSTLAAYGADAEPTSVFGRQCLLARRFLEAGVRFVEVTHDGWDQHRDLSTEHARLAGACDKPIAGLLSDLKHRGMLEDTLVIWGGEFGRTPAAQGDDGRNHNNKGYTTLFPYTTLFR